MLRLLLILTWGLYRVPEELPEAVNELMVQCMESDPKLRPDAKRIYDRLAAMS